MTGYVAANTRELMSILGSSLATGDTVTLEDGVYDAVRLERPIILRARNKWRAWIRGGVLLAADMAVIDGLRVTYAPRFGVDLAADRLRVTNCLVQHNQHGGIHGIERQGCLLEANLVEFNGSNLQFDHGIYLSGRHHIITRNLCRHNAGWNLHLYRQLSDSTVVGNLLHGSIRGRGLLVQADGTNRIVHNTIVEHELALRIQDCGGLAANNVIYGPCDLAESPDLEVTHNSMSANPEWNANPVEWRPRFVRPDAGIYWLKEDSSARGAGSQDALQYGAQCDFYGISRGVTPDLGAFEFRRELTEPHYSAGLYHGWPYQYDLGGLPDPWLSTAVIHRP